MLRQGGGFLGGFLCHHAKPEVLQTDLEPVLHPVQIQNLVFPFFPLQETAAERALEACMIPRDWIQDMRSYSARRSLCTLSTCR